jgi:predicted secreted protein
MAELGKNLKIYSGTTGTTPIIAMAKSCTVSMKADVMEKTSATSSRAKEFIAGRTEWEMSLDHLVPSNSNAALDTLLMAGEEYTVSVVLGGARKTGKAICQQTELRGAVGGLATGSVKFKGNGELTTPSTT